MFAKKKKRKNIVDCVRNIGAIMNLLQNLKGSEKK